MKFSSTSLAFLCVSQASAWTSRSVHSSRHLLAAQLPAVSTAVQGEEATESFRLQFTDGDKPVSPWHDIDLKNDDGSYNMVSDAQCILLDSGRFLIL